LGGSDENNFAIRFRELNGGWITEFDHRDWGTFSSNAHKDIREALRESVNARLHMIAVHSLLDILDGLWEDNTLSTPEVEAVNENLFNLMIEQSGSQDCK
jgi:hypothetical protein